MKILKVACEQFAGIRDFEVEFKDGINIVFGANESGKSSLVNILTETLLKDPRLSKNNNIDKIFINSFFPCEIRNDDDINVQSGNFIDGSVTFETQSGVFKLNKKWRNDGKRCEISLIQPNGDKLDNEIDIKNLLNTELKHGDGIFREILLSQQTVNIDSLRNLIQHSNDFKSGGEIINFLTKKIYAEAGSKNSIKQLENKIHEKISELGKNWNSQRNLPINRVHHCKISDAFKKLEEIKNSANEIKILENRLTDCEKRYNTADNAALKAGAKLEEFRNFEVQLGENKNLDYKIKNINKDLSAYNEAMQEWPKIINSIDKAVMLLDELNQIKFISDMQRRKFLAERINVINKELKNMPLPENIRRDIKTAEKANDIIISCMEKLRGMNLKLEARVNGNYRLDVISTTSMNAAVMKPSKINDNIFEYNIDKAVIVKIPEVAEMSISRIDVNINDVKAEWNRNKEIIYEIINRYELGKEVHSIDIIRERLRAIENEYETKLNERHNLEIEHDNLQKLIKEKLLNLKPNSYAQGGNFFNDGQERSEADVIKDIKALNLTPDNLADFISKRQGYIEHYKKNYTSLDELQNSINNANQELAAASRELTDVKAQLINIPEEYKNSETGLIKAELENNFTRYRNERELALKELNNARYELDRLQKECGDSSKLEAERQQAEREFNDNKEKLAHWENILKIFNKTKEELNKNPVDYLIKKFSSYLDIISGGRLESDNNSNSELTPEIYSRDRRLGWLNISEGTKETIAFAFRLAVIDQIYPDGGAVVVLDDPLVNMDAERAEKACEIIKEFADKNKNQVIFLTCRREYQDNLNGNFIELNK